MRIVVSACEVDVLAESFKADQNSIANEFCFAAEYPNSGIPRFIVTKEYQNWKVPYPSYAPSKYTSDTVLTSPKADIDQLT